MLSKSANAIVGLCFKDGIPYSISIFFDTSYIVDDLKIKLTEELLEEVLSSGKVKELYRGKKQVNLTGIGGGIN